MPHEFGHNDPQIPGFPGSPGGGGGGGNPSDFLPKLLLGHRVRGAADTLGARERLLKILGLLRGKPRFEDFFSSLPTRGPKNGKIFIGVDALRSLLSSGLLGDGKTGGARAEFIERVLDQISPRGGEEPPPGGGLPPGGGGDPSDPGFPDFPGLPEFPGVDPELIDGLTNTLLGLLQNPGIPEDVLQSARNQVRGNSKNSERDAIQRRAEDFAARGLFGSGLQARDVERIEGTFAKERNQALTAIDLANSEQIARTIGSVISGASTLGNLGAQEFGGILDAAQLALSRELGVRGLDLQELALLGDNALQELLLLLTLGRLPGFEGGGSPLDDLFSGGGGRPNRFEIPQF